MLGASLRPRSRARYPVACRGLGTGDTAALGHVSDGEDGRLRFLGKPSTAAFARLPDVAGAPSGRMGEDRLNGIDHHRVELLHWRWR